MDHSHCCSGSSLWTDLDPVVDEAPAVASGPQVGVLLGAGYLDAPHSLPGLVQLAVNRVNTGVVRSYRIAHVRWDAMLLEGRSVEKRESQEGGEQTWVYIALPG